MGPWPAAARGWGRGLSLATAGGVSLVLLLYPYALRGVPDSRVHAGLPLMMLGAAGLFAHGLGFEPALRATRFLLHPVLSWLLFAAGMQMVVNIL